LEKKDLILNEYEQLQEDIKIISATAVDNPNHQSKTPLQQPLNIFSPESTIKDQTVKIAILEAFPGSNIVKWEYNDTKGYLDGNPTTVTANFIQKDTNYFVVEYKDKVTIEDVAGVMRVGKLFNRVYSDVPLGCVLVTKKISKRVSSVAAACKIKLIKI